METKIRKFVIIEENFNGRRIKSFDTKEEWLKEIDELAIDSINKGTFNVEVFEFEHTEEDIETEKVKIFGTQGRKDQSAYVDSIPEEWGNPIFTQEVEYFEILENNKGKFYASYECSEIGYDTKEEIIDSDAPSQYIDF